MSKKPVHGAGMRPPRPCSRRDRLDAEARLPPAAMAARDLAASDILPPPPGHARPRVGACLGRCGFVTVYRSTDGATGAEVALKQLSRLDATSLYQFKREFRALADLSHPNLVQLHELFTESGAWYLTMEL